MFKRQVVHFLILSAESFAENGQDQVGIIQVKYSYFIFTFHSEINDAGRQELSQKSVDPFTAYSMAGAHWAQYRRGEIEDLPPK